MSGGHHAVRMRGKAPDAPPKDLLTVGNRIRFAVYIRSMSFNALNRLMGKGQGYLSKVLSGDRQPRSDSIALLAKALRVPADWLLNGPRQRPTSPAKLAEAIKTAANQARSSSGELAAEAVIRWSLGGLGPLNVVFADDFTNAHAPTSHLVVDEDLRGLSPRELFASNLIGTMVYTSETNGIPWDLALRVADGFLAQSPLKTIERLDSSDITRFLAFVRATFDQSSGTDLYFPKPGTWEPSERKPLQKTSSAGSSLRPRAIRSLPGWDAAFKAAILAHPSVPSDYFAHVGSMTVPMGTKVMSEVDAQFVGEVARALYELALRAKASTKTSST